MQSYHTLSPQSLKIPSMYILSKEITPIWGLSIGKKPHSVKHISAIEEYAGVEYRGLVWEFQDLFEDLGY